MNPPVWELGAGFTLRAPVTVLTNVALAVQALWLTRGAVGSRRGWGLAVRLLAFAAAAGALKHATEPGAWHQVARLSSNLCIGAAMLVPAWTMLEERVRAAHVADPRLAGHHARLRLGVFVSAYLAFVVATVVEGSFLIVVGFSATVVLPVVIAEVHAAVHGRPDARNVAGGLAVGIVAVLAYVLGVRLGPWIGPIDVAHVVLMVALPLLAAGHRARVADRLVLLIVLGPSLLWASVGSAQERPATSVLSRSNGANGLLSVAPPVVTEPVHGLVARCRASVEPDPRAVSVAEALALTPPDESPAALTHALDSLAALFVAVPPEDGVRRRYHEAMLLGARVETLEGRKRIDATRALHALALALLEDAPTHAGAQHILGRINAAVMRLGGTRRLLARVVMGGAVLGSASWDSARAYLERAERSGPCMAEHHLELGLLLADIGDVAGAHREAGHVLVLIQDQAIGEATPDPSRARAAMLRAKATALLGGG